MNDIGNRMKELRENIGLTQNAISTYLDIDKSFLLDLEAGNKPLTISILNGCSTEYLLCESDEFNQTNMALRSEGIQVGDLEGIANINRIYKNVKYLNKKYDEVAGESEK